MKRGSRDVPRWRRGRCLAARSRPSAVVTLAVLSRCLKRKIRSNAQCQQPRFRYLDYAAKDGAEVEAGTLRKTHRSLGGPCCLAAEVGGPAPLTDPCWRNEASFNTRGEERQSTSISDRKGTEGNLPNLFHLISLNHVKTKPQNVLHSGLCPTQCAN